MLYKTISGRKMMTVLSVLLAITVMSGLVAGQYISSASATKKLPIRCFIPPEKEPIL